MIQKYLENPMLIKEKQFNMRYFILITEKLDIYFYNDGYVRLYI